MLRTYMTNRKIRVEESWAINIMRIYKSLLVRVHDVKPHVAFVSRLFGPAAYPQSLFNFQSVRLILVEIYKAYAIHPSTDGLMKRSAYAISALINSDSRLLESRNFDSCMPVFQGLSVGQDAEIPRQGKAPTTPLSESVTWSLILGPAGGHTVRSASLCTAVVYECFRCLYDSEMTVRSVAFVALKCLVEEVGSWYEQSLLSTASEGSWLDIMKSIIIPLIHSGIKSSSDQIKRNFVLLLGHIIRSFSTIRLMLPEADQQCFHLDAVSLLNTDDPEQDFFENIVHLQLHRRVRAMNKLKDLLIKTKNSETQVSSVFSVSTLLHVLLPLACHPLFSDEYSKVRVRILTFFNIFLYFILAYKMYTL